MPRRLLVIALVVSVWAAARALFWVGYAGSDDLFYARYAYLFHRPPANHWEYRMLSIVLLRASFLALGPSELAACLPSLASSAAVFLAVAWHVGWPRERTWSANAAVLLAALLPVDVALASEPGAYSIAAGFLALGTVAFLKEGRRVPLAGAALLTLGFLAHEMSFYYVAVLCLTALAFSWRRFALPVLLCVGLSAAYLLAECLVYDRLLGDPFARLRPAAADAGEPRVGVEADGDAGLFFLLPLRWLLLSRDFGLDFLALFAAGLFAWRAFGRDQKLLFLAAAVYWLWVGYGSMVPWRYAPFSRTTRFYEPLTVAVCALTPAALRAALPGRRLAPAALALLLAVHAACLAYGPRGLQSVPSSRELLRYAQARPGEPFLTNVATLNEMYVLNGFRLPANVACLNSPEADAHLLVNKDPGAPAHHFPEGPYAAVLLNHDDRMMVPETPFREYLRAHRGETAWRAPVTYRLLFRPVRPWVEGKEFAILSHGSEAVQVVEPP